MSGKSLRTDDYWSVIILFCVTVACGEDAVPRPGWHGWPANAPSPAVVPFDTAKAEEFQKAWARHLNIPVEYTNSLGMKFQLIPPGEYFRGSSGGDAARALAEAGNDRNWKQQIASATPRHRVVMTRPFYLGSTEVTQAEFERVMRTNPSHFASSGEGKESVAGMETLRHPVERVTWQEAVEFSSRLNDLEKRTPPASKPKEKTQSARTMGQYRLPTEAEWEHACRAGSVTMYWAGDLDEQLMQAGWYHGNSAGTARIPAPATVQQFRNGMLAGIKTMGRTHAAGELRSNPFGLFDVHGNVWEWVEDKWERDEYAKFSETPAIDPVVRESSQAKRVLRGGDWIYPATFNSSSCRNACEPEVRSNRFGFRVLLTIPASADQQH